VTRSSSRATGDPKVPIRAGAAARVPTRPKAASVAKPLPPDSPPVAPMASIRAAATARVHTRPKAGNAAKLAPPAPPSVAQMAPNRMRVTARVRTRPKAGKAAKPVPPAPPSVAQMAPNRAQLWARVWVFVRGPGAAMASAALKMAGALLSRAWALLAAASRGPAPALEGSPRRRTPGNLHVSDVDLSSPDEALHALRRAARVPPHRRHLDIPWQW